MMNLFQHTAVKKKTVFILGFILQMIQILKNMIIVMQLIVLTLN
jgi:hypothetical protein